MGEQKARFEAIQMEDTLSTREANEKRLEQESTDRSYAYTLKANIEADIKSKVDHFTIHLDESERQVFFENMQEWMNNSVRSKNFFLAYI